LPWVKIFTKKPYKELSEMPQSEFLELWRVYLVVERVMQECFSPDKINMASFGNMLPHVHLHVIARFIDDEYFPNSVWGEKLRENNMPPLAFEPFFEQLATRLDAL